MPIEKMEARWSIKPLSECLEAAAGIMPPVPPECMGAPRRQGALLLRALCACLRLRSKCLLHCIACLGGGVRSRDC